LVSVIPPGTPRGVPMHGRTVLLKGPINREAVTAALDRPALMFTINRPRRKAGICSASLKDPCAPAPT
jgi:hypothetical protein